MVKSCSDKKLIKIRRGNSMNYWTQILISFVVDLIFLGILVWIYSNTKKKATTNRKQTREYGKNVGVGIISGIMVIVLDRWVNSINMGSLKIDWSSVITIGKSSLSALLTALLYVFVLLILVLWVYSIGLPRKK